MLIFHFRLEDVQYRFAVADTDEKLQNMLNVNFP